MKNHCDDTDSVFLTAILDNFHGGDVHTSLFSQYWEIPEVSFKVKFNYHPIISTHDKSHGHLIQILSTALLM